MSVELSYIELSFELKVELYECRIFIKEFKWGFFKLEMCLSSLWFFVEEEGK